MKRIIAFALCMLLAALLLPAAVADGEAGRTEPGRVTAGEAPQGAPELELDGHAPTGYEGVGGRKSEPDFKTQEAQNPRTNATYQLNDALSATLSDGVLTLSGTGNTPDYSTDEPAPWYGVRGEIRSVVIESGVTGLGALLFYDCPNLESVVIPDGVTYIDVAFYQCVSLKRADLPASVRELRTAAFCDCTSLEAVAMPGVETIGSYAFQNTAIRTVTLPKTLKSIDGLAFFNAEVESYAVEAECEPYTAVDGVLYADGGKTLLMYPPKKADASFAVPAQVKTIGENAFICNSVLTEIDLGSVETLGNGAFANCTGLQSVEIPDTVTKAEYYQFEKCTSLESVRFGAGLKKTAYRMFFGCYSLSEIAFGAIEEIDALTFAYCNGLTEITLPETVKVVGNACFGECAQLRSFTTTALEYLPYQALMNCTALSELNLNEGMKTIYRYAVYNARSLSDVEVPASVTIVHDNAFDKRYTAVHVKNTKLTPYGNYGWRMQDYISFDVVHRYDEAFRVLELVNAERAKEGLNPLKIDDELTENAMRRSAELAVLFSHTRPDGSAFYCGYDGNLWGENIAAYQRNADEVMNSWMNSQGHRENILTGRFDSIGVGCVEVGGRLYWTQWFGVGVTDTDCAQRENRTERYCVGFAAETFQEASTSAGVSFWFGMIPEYHYLFDVSDTALVLDAGETRVIGATLTAVCEDDDGVHRYQPLVYPDDQLVWSVEDPSVASVENGVVTAKANGKTVIRVATRNGFFSQTIALTVGRPEIASVAFAEGDVRYKGETAYTVYDGRAKKPRVIVTDTEGAVMDPSAYTVAYRGNTDPGTAFVDVTANGKTVSRMFKIYLPATETTAVSNVESGVRVSWKAVPGAKGYVIYRRAWNLIDSGWTTFERWNNTTATEWIDTKVYAGTRYQYGVKAYFLDPMDNYNLGLVGPLKTTVRITTRRVTDVTPGSKRLTVRWSGSKLFTGYQVQIATDANFTKNVKTVKITNPAQYRTTIKSLKANTVYYVRVRSYHVFEGMTYAGGWSASVQAKTK